jgi:hypothetical protein
MHKPIVLKDFFDQEDFAHIQARYAYLDENKHKINMDYCGNFHRYQSHNDPPLVAIHHKIKDKVQELIGGVPIKTSYLYAVLYDENGYCFPHVDKRQCEFTVDLCVKQSKPWPFYVNHVNDYWTTDEKTLKDNCEEYILEEGDALLLLGTDHFHYRNRMNGDKGDYCHMCFFHFVSEDFEGPLG